MIISPNGKGHLHMKNNLFETISAEVAKGELVERYLIAGRVFSMPNPTPEMEKLLEISVSQRDGNAYQILQAHFHSCEAMSMNVLFQDGASGEFNHDGIIVEFEIKLIRSSTPMYRVLFKRLDAACLKQELRDLHERVSRLESKA